MRAIYIIGNIAIISVVALALCIVASFGEIQESYAVVVDGGSTGSRIFIFKFSFENGNRRVTPESSIKLSPGMSTYANNPDDIVEYFAPALIQAAALIPENQSAQTELYIKATAGMRLIGEKEEQTLWSTLVQGLSAHSEIPFIINPKNFGTIDGYSEGYYAVIASNYIAGSIDGSLHPAPGKEMLGAMDMGGSSTQLIYMLKEPIPGKALTRDDFWLYSWLNFGAEAMRVRVFDRIIARHEAAATDADETDNSRELVTLDNPCSFVDDMETHGKYILRGSGKSEECVDEIKQIMWGKSECTIDSDTTCPLDSVSPPKLGGHFYAMSVYFYALDAVRHLGDRDIPDWPTPKVDDIELASHEFCKMHISEVRSREKHPYTKDSQLKKRCFEGIYISTLLEHGFRVHGEKKMVTLALEVEGVEVEWTLGFSLSEINTSPPVVAKASTS